MSTNENRSAAFRAYVKKMASYNQAISVLYWDKSTQAPKKEWMRAQK